MSLKRTFGTMANKILHDAKNREFYALLNDKKGIYRNKSTHSCNRELCGF